MNITIFTLFPELYEPFTRTSIIGRAQQQQLVHIATKSLFEYAQPKERIDGPTFGHGAGMVIKPDIIERAITQEKQEKAFKIFFSPHGTKLDQEVLLSLKKSIQERDGNIALFPARYEGMDARIEEEYADIVLSVGDFVLMGGDVPAMVLLEGLLRLIPGIVGKEESVRLDSFSGPFVDYPEYTMPQTWRGRSVPEVLRSGNHKLMQEWRDQQAAQRTVLHHFDWLRSHVTKKADKERARHYMPPHYAVLMHDQVIVENKEGATSVTSIDIHDIARAAATFGIKNYFVVTPLADQQKIVETLLNFWRQGAGVAYNPHRHEALKAVDLQASLAEVLEVIEKEEGKKPLLIATSANQAGQDRVISYEDQEKIWSFDRPVVLLFGTGHGLGPSVMEKVDFILMPIEGFTDFNHLSVRSAAAIIFDRWLGIHQKKLYTSK